MTQHIGITASRNGPVQPQRRMLLKLLTNDYDEHPEDSWFHHGDCIGGDITGRAIAHGLGYRLYGHPPTDSKQRAFSENDLDAKPLPYMDRNKAIVDAVQHLYVMPDDFEEKLRSGTWATWRYAQKTGTPWTIIFPDGTLRNSKRPHVVKKEGQHEQLYELFVELRAKKAQERKERKRQVREAA